MSERTQREKNWIGVGLDRTLAYYTVWNEEIGEPIPAMMARVRQWLDEGEDVRIFTARVADHGHTRGEVYAQFDKIQAWTKKHLGEALPVTATKDMFCKAIYDDLAFHVVPNEGRIA